MSGRYRHTQIGWVIIVGLLGLIVTLLAVAELSTSAAAVAGVLAIVLLLFGTLTVTVDADAMCS